VAKQQETDLIATRGARRDGRVWPRGKRDEILASAVEHFGQRGYEETKWADVAADVGIGSTALYHYVESKLHCLYAIMAEALESFQRDFEQITHEHDDYLETLLALVRATS
jgi:TetR/AcrR family transcriptional regulator, cholesterol catabolism regulator